MILVCPEIDFSKRSKPIYKSGSPGPKYTNLSIALKNLSMKKPKPEPNSPCPGPCATLVSTSACGGGLLLGTSDHSLSSVLSQLFIFFSCFLTVSRRNQNIVSLPSLHSISEPINQMQRVLINHCVKIHRRFKHYHNFGTKKPKNKPRGENPQKNTQNRRRKRPTPFVADVKEIHDPDEALSLFHQYYQMGYKHDYPSFSSLIYKLAKSQNFEAVETLLGRLQDLNIHCKETLFCVLFQHYGKAYLSEKVIELFHAMPSFNCVRTVQSLNWVLNVLVDNNRFSDAKEIFDKSKEMGFRPNSITFNVMIKGSLKRAEFNEACNLFDEMLERNVEPSVVTYNSFIGFLCKNGDVEKAKSLVEDMSKKGKYPTAVTYALLMDGLCSLGEYKEAKKLMFDMEYKGCKTKVINFGVLMSYLGKRGEIEEAKSLLSEMKKRRFKPDVVIYNILVNYLCKENRVEEAYKILIEMQVKGCEPNAATYRMMVDGFCMGGDFEGALKVLNVMLTSRHCPRPDTFCRLVAGLLERGKIDGACFVLEEMEKRQMSLDLDVWGALIKDACVGVDASELLTQLTLVQ